MRRWGKFSTLKERGEWVELQFMAAVASRGYHVLKPYGDSLAYDVGIDHGGRLMRVQVKSTSVRNGTGYFCQFRRNYLTKHLYTVEDVDPEDWKWSSFLQWATGAEGRVEIECPATAQRREHPWVVPTCGVAHPPAQNAGRMGQPD
jgi:hypothetical protein